MKCVVTDYVEPDLAWEAERYESHGIEFEARQLRNADAATLGEFVRDADVVIVDQAKLTRAVFERMARCKLVIRHGDGYDNVDIDAATELGIIVANKPGFWSQEVAELAFSLSLSMMRKVPLQQHVAYRRSEDSSGWDLSFAMPQHRFSSQTIGLLGCGRIGSRIVTLLKPVCLQVLVHDPYIDSKLIVELGARPATWDELLTQSDLISIHVPATKETLGLFADATIDRMKQGAVLINTARGAIVNTDSLLRAIESSHLGGAALDVTEPEPLPAAHELFRMPNVIITPHMGWYSEEALWAMRMSIVEDVISAARHSLPQTVVNSSVVDQPSFRMKGAKNE